MSGTQELQESGERLPQNDLDLRFDFGSMVECESGREEQKQYGAGEWGFQMKNGRVDDSSIYQRIHE